jgi:hypothetical protein
VRTPACASRSEPQISDRISRVVREDR